MQTWMEDHKFKNFKDTWK